MKTKQRHNLINGNERIMFKQFMAIMALALAITLTAGVQAQAAQDHWDDLLKLEFPGYYLTEKSAARMHAEIDFQRA